MFGKSARHGAADAIPSPGDENDLAAKIRVAGQHGLGQVGGTTPLASLTASGLSVVQSSSVQSVGNVNYTGQVQLGGNITTSGLGNSILMTGPVVCNTSPSISLTTNAGTVTITGTIDGDTAAARSLTIATGTANSTFQGVIGGGVPLNNFTASSELISIEGVGGLNNGVAGTLTLNSSTNISFVGTNYIAGSQSYTTPGGDFFNMLAGSGTLFSSDTGSIDFIGGTIHLSAGTDFFVTTANQDLTFPALTGTFEQNVTFNLGTAAAHLGSVGGFAPNDILSFTVDAGSIFYNGPIQADSFSHSSLGSITNVVPSPNITGSNYQVLNAIGGSIGTVLDPVRITAPTSIVVAGASGAAYFIGATADGTVHCLPVNPPALLVFNGVVQSCGNKPTPSPITKGPLGGINARDYYIPWIYDADYNLSSDFFFKPDLISRRYINPREAPMYGIKQNFFKNIFSKK